MKIDAYSRHRYYAYKPDSNAFAGVTFAESISGNDSPTIADLHWEDSPYGTSWKVRECVGFDDNPSRTGDFPSVSDYNRVPMM
ncbi:MAG: hypothetical protein ACK5T6_07435, partial [Pirellula sp.]